MPVPYPTSLPLPLRADRVRSREAAFSSSNPRRGAPYFEPTGTDTPTTWSLTWRLTEPDAALFVEWVDDTLSRGALEFTIPLRTETGLRAITAHFLDGGLLDTRRDGALWLYTAQIVARSGTGPLIEESTLSDNLQIGRKLERWAFGPTAAVAATTMKIDNLFESSTFPLAAEAGIWAQQTYTAWGFSHEFTAASVPSAGGSPLTTGFFYANNNGSPGDVVALIASAIARTSGGTVFGANVLARNSPGNTGTKLVGMEIDLQPTSGTTVGAGTAGLYINAFNLAMTANAIQLGGVGGGSFSDGLVISGVTGAGLSPNGSTTMRALVDSGSATYGDAAVVLRNGHKLRLTGTASTHGFLYNDGSDNVRMVVGSGGRWTLRNSADTTALVSLLDVGGQGVVNIETSGGEYRLNGTKVLGARVTGWSLPTGTLSRAAFDQSTVTLPQLAQRVAALVTDFYSNHGAIGA